MAIVGSARSLISSGIHAPLMIVLTEASLSANQVMSCGSLILPLGSKKFQQQQFVFCVAGIGEFGVGTVDGQHNCPWRCNRRCTLCWTTSEETVSSGSDGIGRGTHICTIELQSVQIHLALTSVRQVSVREISQEMRAVDTTFSPASTSEPRQRPSTSRTSPLQALQASFDPVGKMSDGLNNCRVCVWSTVKMLR